MQLSEYTLCLDTLSNKKRLMIIDFLAEGPKTVTEIYGGLGFEQSTVSKNLKALQKCGFVFVEPRGQQRVYSVNRKSLFPLLKLMGAHTRGHCRKAPCFKEKMKTRGGS